MRDWIFGFGTKTNNMAFEATVQSEHGLRSIYIFLTQLELSNGDRSIIHRTSHINHSPRRVSNNENE